MARYKVQPTPNPDSFKITRRKGTFITTGVLAFSNKEEAESHPLAKSLFEIIGVTNVLILPQFITVSKTPESDWRALWNEVEEKLKEHDQHSF